jgi:hypothetical protein
VRKVARTVADLRGAAAIDGRDVIRALRYRALDREAADQAWGPGATGTAAPESAGGDPSRGEAAAPALAVVSSS